MSRPSREGGSRTARERCLTWTWSRNPEEYIGRTCWAESGEVSEGMACTPRLGHWGLALARSRELVRQRAHSHCAWKMECAGLRQIAAESSAFLAGGQRLCDL